MPGPSLCGIIVVDKPAGMTSRKVVDRIQNRVRPSKAGHAGTLDPMATGVLVVCIGAATRLISFVQEQRKVYRAAFLLGQRSDTDDVTGAVEHVPVEAPPETETIRAALPAFVGRIQQIPPRFSAVHVEGQRAYDLARRGEEVELAPRPVDVYRIDIEQYAWPELRLEIECGSGTYIRSIGRDLGNVLGCGAAMSELTRTSIGSFDLASAAPFDVLETLPLGGLLRPASAAAAHLPQSVCDEASIDDLRHGRAIEAGNLILREGARVACVTPRGDLVAVCERRPETGRLHPRVVLPPEWSVSGVDGG